MVRYNRFIQLGLLLSCLLGGSASARKKEAKKATVKTETNLALQQIGESKLPKEFAQVNELRKKTEKTRFKKIQIDNKKAMDEIKFWSHQLSEHALFLHLGLEDAKFKKEGLKLHKKFETFRKKMTVKNMHKVLPLAKELRRYKIEVLSTLASGKWIGWIFPLFARHIILELDYFVDKLNGIKYTDQDEIAFWNIINGEHAGFAAHLLDPSERALFEAADGIAKKFEKTVTSEKEMFVKISQENAKELDAYFKKAEGAAKANKLQSVIHPALIAHVIREGERSLQMLNSLSNTKGAIYPHPETIAQ